MAQLVPVWYDTTNVTAGGNSTPAPSSGRFNANGFANVTSFDKLRHIASNTGGTYALELDWSRDGVTADFTEAVTVTASTTKEVPVAAAFVKPRVRNTGGAAFTAHKTSIVGIYSPSY